MILLAQTPLWAPWHEAGHVFQAREDGRDPEIVSWTRTYVGTDPTPEILAGGFYYEYGGFILLALGSLFYMWRRLVGLRAPSVWPLAIATGGTVGSFTFMWRSSDFARVVAMAGHSSAVEIFLIDYVWFPVIIIPVAWYLMRRKTWTEQLEKRRLIREMNEREARRPLR